MASQPVLFEQLTFLASLYPGFKLRKATILAYGEILSDIPDELFRRAVQAHGQTGKFFPSAAELRETAFSLTGALQGMQTAADAWATVCKQIRLKGTYDRPYFRDPLIYRAIDAMGGWRAVCLSETAMADRAHFIKIYEMLAARVKSEIVMHPETRAFIGQMQEAHKALSAGNDVKRLTAGLTKKLSVGPAVPAGDDNADF